MSLRGAYYGNLMSLDLLSDSENWKFVDCNTHINYNHLGPETDFFMGVLRHPSFMCKVQNNCTNEQE